MRPLLLGAAALLRRDAGELAGAAQVGVGAAPLGHVAGHGGEARAAEGDGADRQVALRLLDPRLEIERLAARHDPGVLVESRRPAARRQLAGRAAAHLLGAEAALALERRVDLQGAIVDDLAVALDELMHGDPLGETVDEGRKARLGSRERGSQLVVLGRDA